MLGDQTLFVRTDGMQACWALVTDVLHTWEDGEKCARCVMETYAAGSWGPKSADALLAADGRHWGAPEPGQKG